MKVHLQLYTKKITFITSLTDQNPAPSLTGTCIYSSLLLCRQHYILRVIYRTIALALKRLWYLIDSQFESGYMMVHLTRGGTLVMSSSLSFFSKHAPIYALFASSFAALLYYRRRRRSISIAQITSLDLTACTLSLGRVTKLNAHAYICMRKS